jgi:4-hydroxy-2-oxoheptanedioate aldolase
MITSGFKQKLKNGHVAVGAFYKTNNQNMVEMMAYAGYDFIIVDNEHSNFDHVDIENIVRAADGANLDTIIRIPSGSEENILHSLDSGATGIQVPSLRNVDDVKKLVPYTKYYPQGHRGINANQRAAKYGFMDSTEYFKAANDNTLIVVHVENLEMAEQVEELCQIPEIDVVFIGPGDLSQAVGKPLQVNAPEVIKVVDGIIEKTKKSGKIIGVWVGNQKDAQTYIDKGAQYLGFMSDSSIIVNALKEAGKQVEALKQYSKRQ